jgi:REP-associated tyrosine transposase
MRDWQSLAHVRWECKYHIVWVPKYRRKVLYGRVRRRFAEIVRDLCRQLGVEVIEGHAMVDHVHLYVSFAPKYTESLALDFSKATLAGSILQVALRPCRRSQPTRPFPHPWLGSASRQQALRSDFPWGAKCTESQRDY